MVRGRVAATVDGHPCTIRPSADGSGVVFVVPGFGAVSSLRKSRRALERPLRRVARHVGIRAKVKIGVLPGVTIAPEPGLVGRTLLRLG